MFPRRWFLLAAVGLGLALCGLQDAFALELIGGRTTRGRRHERRPSRYYVYQLKGLDGSVTFEVVPDIEAADWRKEIRDSYEEAIKDWIIGYKMAKKRGEKYTEPRPRKPAYRIVKSFRKEKDAQDYADKCQERWDKMLEAKRAKEGGVDLGKLKREDQGKQAGK